MGKRLDHLNPPLLRWLLANFLTVPVVTFLLIEGILKEMPLFWRNAGGYAVGFRHWVLYSFYPSFFIVFAWLSYLTVTYFQRRSARFVHLHPVVALLPLGLSWFLLFATGVTVITDNLQNLWHGDSLHAPRGIGPD